MITIYYDCSFLNSERVSIIFSEQAKDEELEAIERGGGKVTKIEYS